MTSSLQNNGRMNLTGPADQLIEKELDVIERMLPLDAARVLELGCGAADKTRAIAERTAVANITAVEIDAIQHEKNLRITDLPKVEFQSYGAEDIQANDSSFDVVMMFKSLHHVPGDCLDQALREICRVLKPGGFAYISEPVFAGAFNEIMRLFHDEEVVRREAFNAVERAIDNHVFDLKEEYFFKNRMRLESFEQFEAGMLNATHTDHQLNDATLGEVKARFQKYESNEGFVFEVPNRIDLLLKPA